ncbi:lysophospholipase L1-like esterase [Terriglobus roseus DSM 18391]|uniref:Lysophospholipase L1-like esterase n=1 Tax=Terriglobus roseus (strain DSM 18391 / NRRL B-41598 / KBS 63) TaxID=926566 RepID=I3ZH14_TERRK|nr:arylesterase [Terriglobus roseus]AFL88532.1 lysophospholipase L1-like esterase [Terriglobus roseus DSM 18391]AFL88872.1 lysophospholipase L1-like esterase [Terriglobus roseus DSM 18391]
MLTVCAVLAISGCEAERHERPTDSTDGGATPLGSMTSHTPTVTPNAPTATDSRPVIAAFGDSLTAGYGVDMESSYPADLQRDLDKAGYRYRVVNMGISGDTTKDGLARVERVLALKPAIVVVEFGGNDGLRGVPVASSRTNLDSIVNKLQSSGTQVAMAGITLPPQYSQPYIKSFNETYTLLAKKYHVPLLPFVLQDVYGVPGSIQQDGIHPTAQGCKQVSKNIFGLIKPLLKK